MPAGGYRTDLAGNIALGCDRWAVCQMGTGFVMQLLCLVSMIHVSQSQDKHTVACPEIRKRSAEAQMGWGVGGGGKRLNQGLTTELSGRCRVADYVGDMLARQC